MKFNEQYTVENHIIKFIQEKLGYKYIKPEEFSKLREFESEFLIVPLLAEAIKKINKFDDDMQVQNIIREIKKVDTNEGFLNVLRDGVNLKDPETGKMQDYLIVDFDNFENNQFVVTNQFYFEGSSENIRPDVLIFLNGVPVVDIEAKSPTASSSVSYENAIGQIKRYEKNAQRLFLPNCFNIVTDGLKTMYGATYASKQYFLQWRDEELEKELGGELEMTLTALLSKKNILDVIENFILFENEKDSDGIVRTIKKICRYQQMRATNKILERVKKGEEKRGLIWHTQGSGKSLTMFFTAWKLRFEKTLNNPKIFILVDRIDLDDQIYNTFINCGGKNVERITSRRELEKKIKSSERGIYISTIQKFSELGSAIENLDENVIVLSDEAHRDNEGVSAINLRSAMKNAFFFGFTGTPIDKNPTNTHRNFGQDGERYLDYYSIKQAIDDGATLPVTYEARLSKFFIDETAIEAQFDALTVGLTEEEKNKLIKKYGKKEALIKLDSRMEAVAQDIIEHYRLYVEPNGFKAQVVCYDRMAAAKYKEFFDKLVPSEWSEVVFSPGDPNSDADDLKKYNTNKAERENIIARFKDPNDPLKFLIVCDMLLTGFDAPLEQVMYLDKPLRDHNLLQAIARTNRVYQNKGCGKIIDYYGVTRNLYEALNFDESVVESAMIDIEKVKKEFTSLLNDIMQIFNGVNIEDPTIINLRKCLGIFAGKEELQQKFSEKYGRLKLLFEILSPDPFLKQYLRKFEWITSFYLAFSKEFKSQDDDMSVLAEYGEKVKKLIQEKIDYEGITKNFRELTIHDLATLDNQYFSSDEEKARALEKLLKREISINLDLNPIFQKFSERLAAIRSEFEKSQIELAERIKKYYELLKEIKAKNSEAGELGYNLREYGVFVISQEFVTGNDENLKEFVIDLTSKIEAVTSLYGFNWQSTTRREEILKEVKKEVQKIVLSEYREKISVSDFSKYLNRIVDIVIKKF
ncbi:MAG: hypothetical protein ACD_8C00124G0011 [uncultured bacterium]|nr:MAG: hypothetical protein ACD_8C00124G0011 [uncultured bacterium]